SRQSAFLAAECHRHPTRRLLFGGIDKACPRNRRFGSGARAEGRKAPEPRQRSRRRRPPGRSRSDAILKVFRDFERNAALLAEFDAVAKCYSASCVFADVQYRQGVMDCEIKPAFRAKVVGQALTVQLSPGDLVDPLKALEIGRPGDIIVVDA